MDPLLSQVERALRHLPGRTVDAVELRCPSIDDADLFAIIVSKLSPLLGNLFESEVVRTLNKEVRNPGFWWVRQDPGFPDVVLTDGAVQKGPGIEIKAWYVHSTEITGRFRESVNLLAPRDVHVALIAWTMSEIIHGKPRVLDVALFPAADIALQRDRKYHNPPNYICREPEDTTSRTINLQQSNVNGYKLQGTAADLASARSFVRANASAFRQPSHTAENQAATTELARKYPFRLDTNFAKLDRIEYGPLEAFKRRMLRSTLQEGLTVLQWTQVLRRLTDEVPSPRALALVADLL